MPTVFSKSTQTWAALPLPLRWARSISLSPVLLGLLSSWSLRFFSAYLWLFGFEVSAKTIELTLLLFGPSAPPPPKPFEFFPPYSPSTLPQISFLMVFSPPWILLQMLLSACSADLVARPCYWEAILHWYLKLVHCSSSEHLCLFFRHVSKVAWSCAALGDRRRILHGQGYLLLAGVGRICSSSINQGLLF